MVSPVQLNGNQKVYFRGGEDLINSPGAFQQQTAPEIPNDSVELSTKSEKKGSVGKFIGGLIGTVAATALALWGLFKGKGDKWLVKNPEGTVAKIKKWAVTPGEWLDRNVKSLYHRIRGNRVEGEAPKPEGGSTPAAGEGAATGSAPTAGGTGVVVEEPIIVAAE